MQEIIKTIKRIFLLIIEIPLCNRTIIERAKKRMATFVLAFAVAFIKKGCDIKNTEAKKAEISRT